MIFTDTNMYRRGQIGEEIVDNYIINSGKFIPFAPMVEDKAHPFDRILASVDKKSLMIAEVKTIDARDYYPDTGISISNFREYLNIENKYNLEVWIFFVDSKLGKIYGNTLSKLRNETKVNYKGKVLEYPMKSKNFTANGGEIIYFPLENMVDIKKLNDIDIQRIKNQHNKEYRGLKDKKGYYKWKEGNIS